MQRRVLFLLFVLSIGLTTSSEASSSRRRAATGNLAEVEGVIAALASDQVTIRGRMGDRSARLTASTIIAIDGHAAKADALEVGLEVEAVLRKELDGTFTAHSIEIETDDRTRGIVKSISAGAVDVDTNGGLIRFSLTPSTVVLLHGKRVTFDAIAPGMRVTVESLRGTGDVRRALVLEVKSEVVEIEGVVTGISPDSITVRPRSGVTITIGLNKDVVVRRDGRITNVGTITIGSRVEVKALRIAAGALLAVLVEVADENELLEIEGEIIAISADSLTVRTRSGDVITVTLDGDTIVRSDDQRGVVTDLRVGDHVEIQALPAGTVLKAIRIEVDDDDDDRYVEIEGIVKAITGSTLTIQTADGRSVVVSVTSRTEFRRDDSVVPFSSLTVGDRVEITAARNADGSLEALYVEVDDESDDGEDDLVELEGKIIAVSSTSITIHTRSGDVTIAIDSATIIKKDDRHGTIADLSLGQRVEVKATRTGSSYLAKVIEIEDEDDH